MSEEVWKDIPDYEGYYQASNLGNIRSLDREVLNNGTYYTVKGKILSQSTHYKNGYKSVMFTVDSKQKRLLVHRLVMFAFNGNNNLDVNHRNGDKSDNRLSNLEWCTKSENTNHGFANDLMCDGESHHKTFLKEDQVRDIKLMLKKGCTNREIALKYQVRTGLINDIKKGRTWKKIVL